MSKVLEQLKRAVERSPKSRYAIAQETGVSQAALSRFVNGERGLSVDAVERVAVAVGLELALRKKGR